MMSRRRSRGCAVAGRQPSGPDAGRVNVPKLNRDPVSSLRPYSVTVTIGSDDVEVPALSAADWLSVLMVERVELDDIFPGLLSVEDTDTVEEAILDGSLDIEEFRGLILGVIETASARQWWVALRLVEVARTSWDVIGAEMIFRGVDAESLSLSAWLDVLLLTILRNMEPKDTQMFTMRLETPPPEEKGAAEELEMSQDAFMAMAMG
jgi:hypothetical protein